MTSILNPDNHLFTLARQGRHLPSALAAIAVVFVILVLSIILGQIPARIVLGPPDGVPRFPNEIQSIAEPIVENLTFMLIYICLWVWLRLSSKRPFWTLGFERSTHSGALSGEWSLRD